MRLYRWLVHLYGLLAIIFIGCLFVLPPRGAEADQTLNHSYPKVANLYLSSPLSAQQVKDLSQWDVVILHMMDQMHFAPEIKELRRLNPNIKILAYITSEEFPTSMYQQYDPDPNGLWHKLLAGITPDMWLTDANGKHITFWADYWMLNVTNYPSAGIRWNEYLADFVNREILSTGLWDGIFFDNTWTGVSWIKGGAMDANRDGQNDAPADLDRAWENGMNTLFKLVHAKAGPNVILLGNGDRGYYNDLNGLYIENFTQNSSPGWAERMRLYHLSNTNSLNPQIAIVGNTSPGRAQNNYRAMRYGLASALMENGYYGFDGMDSHAEIWWYDEFNAKLGSPTDVAATVTGTQVYNANAVWRRNYETGLALVNPTGQAVSVDLGGEYEKLIGKQDPTVNNGAIVTNVSVPAQDGLIMLKTFRTLKNTVFINGAFVRFFTAAGARTRNGFFAFEENIPGGSKIFSGDLDGNGIDDKIVVSGPKIEIFNELNQHWFVGYPFGSNFKGEINLALSKINGDPTPTLAFSSSLTGQIVLYTYYGELVRDDIYPLGKKYRQGFSVAVASTKFNGKNELVLSTGRGRQTEVIIYDLKTNKIAKRFSPYGAFSGGASVAVGDFNGDGAEEIATVATYNRQPLVRTFNFAGKRLSQFNVSGLFSAKPFTLSAVDLNQSGKKEIVVMTSD